MSHELEITTGAPRIALPLDVVTQSVAILAVRGAGKSTTAAALVEELYGAQLPFCVIDPMGTWWGLKTSADGKHAGLEIPVFGGRAPYSDLPLEAGAGAHLADVVASKRLSCVVDVSEFGENEKRRFLLDFAKRLYRKNRDPLHLVLEEADDYAPQKPGRGGLHAELLGAWEDIVRRGRARGLGMTMITQRSAVLNKNVLTQVETLIAMRTTAPQDRQAIRDWIDYHGASRAIHESLPTLESGEAWVISPHWLGVTERVQIRPRRTFDSGATPKVGKSRRAPTTMAALNLDELRAEFAEAVERAKEDDPKELRQRIAKLERELAAAAPAAERIEITVPVLTDDQVAMLLSIRSGVEASAAEIQRHLDQIKVIAASVESQAKALAQRPSASPARVRTVAPPAPARTAKPSRSPTGDGSLSTPQLRIIEALARWAYMGVAHPTRHQVAFVAGYTVNGHFNNTVTTLNSAGLVEYPVAGCLALTSAGSAAAPTIEGDVDLIASVRGVLRGEPQIRVFDALVARGGSVSRETLAADCGYTVNGHFNNVVGSLKSLGIAIYPAPGNVGLSPDLFG